MYGRMEKQIRQSTRYLLDIAEYYYQYSFNDNFKYGTVNISYKKSAYYIKSDLHIFHVL